MILTREKGFGKVNLGLDVTGKREDGYHEIRSVMQTIGLFDEICIRKLENAPEGHIEITVTDPHVPADETNIAWKVAEYMVKEFGITQAFQIEIEKNIPAAAGMAGGSADCAATIRAMNRLFELGLDEEQMYRIGARFGADVPFCLRKGTYLAEGIGERLTAVEGMPQAAILLVTPHFEVSTPWAYEAFDHLLEAEHPDIDALIKAIEGGNLDEICHAMGNSLEKVTASVVPEIYNIEEAMLDAGAKGSIMSGSGPTVFGIFEDLEKAERTYDRFCAHPHVGRAYITVLLHNS